MPRTLERSCGTKRQYETRHLAITAMRAIRHNDGRPGLSPYRCEFCRYYHLGHSIPPGRIPDGER